MNLILALNSGGQPHDWITWQDAVVLKYKNLIAWELGEKTFSFRAGISKKTGHRTVIDVPSILAIKSKFKYKDRTPTLTNKNLFRRDLHLCGYCGGTFKESLLTRDHIVPVSKGGKSDWTNCVTACYKCNWSKGSKLLEQTSMELLYVPYVPDRAEALVLQNRNILADQMDFLQSFIPKHSRIKKLV